MFEQTFKNIDDILLWISKKSILQKVFKRELSSPEGALSANDGRSPSR